MGKLVDLEQYTTLPRPNVDWIITDLIPRPSIIMLFGEPKVGKSWLALQIALAVAQGHDNLMGHTIKPTTVLYLQFDTSEFVWRYRLRGLVKDGVSLAGPVYMLHPEDQPTRVNILNEQHFNLFRAMIATCDPGLVVIDVLREIHNSDEQDSTQMKWVGDAIAELCQGRALLLLHHPRKPSTDPKAQFNTITAARGSSYLAGKVDVLWLIHAGYLHIEGRLGASCRVKLKQAPTGLWTFPVVEYEMNRDQTPSST